MDTTIIMHDTPMLRLLQLVSPALPVGGYSFSHGLEYAVEKGWVNDEKTLKSWVQEIMATSLARVDLPILLRVMQAQSDKCEQEVLYWNNYSLACRETEELLLSDMAMGKALLRLLKSLDVETPSALDERVSFVAVFGVAAEQFGVDQKTACTGYLWSWLENQITSATKVMPLGQTAAQKLLFFGNEAIIEAVEAAIELSDDEVGGTLPALAMASALHETQYSRLFRS